MKQITPFSIVAPGFYGLNTQDAPVELDKGFALEAINCIIDKSGRIAARKGWSQAHTTNADLGTSSIELIAEVIANDGTAYTIAAGNGKLFKHSGTTLTTLTYGGGGSPPTITTNKWQFCQLNGVGILWQRGYDPLIFDPAVSTTTYRRLSEKSGSTGTIYQCNAAISAYGRIWSADISTDKQTVVWSDILTPHIWTGGTAGSLDLRQVWPAGGDEIVGFASHNNRLFIFGKRQIIIYQGADDPTTMKLEDTIIGVGCISRDTIITLGEDVWFLSDTGLRSLQRTIQENAAPFRTLSKNVHSDIQDQIGNESSAANIRAGYSSVNSLYLLHFPTSGTTYAFDTKSVMQDGSARTTMWQNIAPTAFCETRSRKFYLGQEGYIGEYTGYLDDATQYRMSYYTTWIDFGNPIQTSILKKILLTVIGGANQTVVFKWAYDFIESYFSQSTALSGISAEAEYGIAEYGIAEYNVNLVANVLSVNGSSAGRVLKFGFEAQLASKPLSIQKIDLFTKDGRF